MLMSRNNSQWCKTRDVDHKGTSKSPSYSNIKKIQHWLD
jgi:hypothetical protein